MFAKLYSKYLTNTTNKSRIILSDKIKATENWVECQLDIIDMQNALMSTHNINEKYRLMEALEKAEKRKKFMYNHKNFNGYRAGIILSAAKNGTKIAVA